MSGFTIIQETQQAGVRIETIRFYERKGVIKDPPRRASGCRRSEANSVHQAGTGTGFFSQ